jgi:DNA segregation ATPase FtsK/SpoIIIE, S-DNA-T family
VRLVVDTLREAWWVARCLPRLVSLAVLVLLLLLALGQYVQGTGVAAALAGLLLWPSWGSQSWYDVVDRRVTLDQRRGWVGTASSVGLSVSHSGQGGQRVVPRLLRGSRTRDGVSVLRLRLAAGQTLDDVERAGPALAALLGGHSVRVSDDGPSCAVITLALRDVLARVTVTPTARETPVGRHPAVGVELGRVRSGQAWTVDARVHTLVAGSTGAGKASVMWSLVAGLAPAVRAGTVRLVGVDLKAGMELLHAKALFSTLAITPESAVAVLEREAELMAARAAVMAGTVRSHTPAPEDPHVIVLIDELAAITRYCRIGTCPVGLTRRFDCC